MTESERGKLQKMNVHELLLTLPRKAVPKCVLSLNSISRRFSGEERGVTRKYYFQREGKEQKMCSR